MPRRCPPGVFCIENVTIMFICVIFLIVGVILYYGGRPHTPVNRGHSARGCDDKWGCGDAPYKWGRGGVPQGVPQKKGVGEDVFFDIYKSPLRDDRCMTGGGGDIRGAIPINVSTQGCDDAQYRQVGILTRIGGSSNEETILPLMGRPLFSKRDKWNFYTLNDKNNMIKLPVKINGKSGTSEYGCDNVYNGDTIYVEGYNAAFKFTTYENQVMRYLPNSL
jgi:hypothetical protein